jgi:hypothetical protein
MGIVAFYLFSMVGRNLWAIDARKPHPEGRDRLKHRKPANRPMITGEGVTVSSIRGNEVITLNIFELTGLWAVSARKPHHGGWVHLKHRKPANSLGEIGWRKGKMDGSHKTM